MVYRRTKKVIDRMRDRHHAIIAAAINIISKGGWKGYEIDKVAVASGVGVGTIYKYFANRDELDTAVVRMVIDDHIEAMHDAARRAPDAIGALASVLMVFVNRHIADPKLGKAVMDKPFYRDLLADDIETYVRKTARTADGDSWPYHPVMCGRAIVGAVRNILDTGMNQPRTTVMICMRIAGVKPMAASGAVDAIKRIAA
jgi:AcrR family transcriptional regulator